MSQTRSLIVNPGLSPKATPSPASGLRPGTEDLSPGGGLRLVKQVFEGRESRWLSGMLGGYFPSLPRVVELKTARNQIQVTLGSCPGEPVADYCQRVGQMQVGVACVLVWRLAAELDALESWIPEGMKYMDPLSCRVGLWQQEFLQLFIDRFEPPYENKKPADLPSRLLKLCGMLISGQDHLFVDPGVAARVPSSLLTPLRQLHHTGSAGLDLKQLKGLMLMTTAAVTRGLRGSNLMPLLVVGEALHPRLPRGPAPLIPPERRYGLRLPLSTVRLSRLLAHRNKLNGGEIHLLMQHIQEQAATMPGVALNLDPQYIHLHLPHQRDGANDTKMLDGRLDSLPEFGLSLQHLDICPALARSPVAIKEADAPDHAFSDLRGCLDAQLGRLSQTLQDGTFSLSGYDLGSSSSKDLPGLFACQLPLPPIDQKALASLKTAIGESLAVAKTPAPSAGDFHDGIQAFLTKLHSQYPLESMKMILITAGSGGTGKSTVARLIYELANFENRDDVAMFDCDALGNRDFQKISPSKIESMPIDNVDTMRRLVETAMDRKLVLADLPASCQDVLARDLNPEIIQSLRVDEGLHWMPIHLLTAKAAAVPAINQWRTSVFGDSPSVLIVSMKDGPVTSDMLDEVARPQDIVLRLPVLDQSLASALDASSSTWLDILDGKAPDSHRMFSNPLVKRQLRFKRKECEDALFPLLRLIVNDHQATPRPAVA